LILTPSDVVKQRLQLGQFRTTMECVNFLWATEGFKGFFRSVPITLVMNVPYSSIMVASNESIKKIWSPSGKHNMFSYFICAGMAASIAAILTNPLDVIKTRLQTQSYLSSPSLHPTTTGIFSPKLLGKPILRKDTVEASSGGFLSFSTTKEGANGKLNLPQRGVFSSFNKILAEEGFVGFFRGVTPRLVMHAPSAAISWAAYETIKKTLEKR